MERILIIDDDIELCELVTEYLEPEGYAVEAIDQGQVGVQRALSGDHALAVLDYMLPGLNGFEVLRLIRAASQLPVVMLTARGDRKSTRLNSSHRCISYAVFCLKKKNQHGRL